MNLVSRIKEVRTGWLDVFLVAVFFLSNLTALAVWFNFWIFITAYRFVEPQMGMAGLNAFLWIIAVILVGVDTKKLGDWPKILTFVKTQKTLVIFIICTFLSIFWSINPWVSVYKVFQLICSTCLGLYIGYRYKIPRLLDLLFWFFSFILYFSAFQAISQPGVGTMEEYPYFGAWCGPFWNRNHLGSLASLAATVFLIRLITRPFRQNKLFLVDLFNFILAIFIVYKAESATGYILTAALIGTTILAQVWMKFRHRMTKKHYWLILIVIAVGIVGVVTNLDLIFALLNRKATLTGRVPMWNFLVSQVIGRSPWIGYGFGAIWSMGIFREGIRFAVNWPRPLLIADNGYFDILLSVGILGFIPFFLTFITVWIKTIKMALASNSLFDFFPAIFMFYVLIANISFSMFLETETFIWMLMMAVWVGLANQDNRANP